MVDPVRLAPLTGPCSHGDFLLTWKDSAVRKQVVVVSLLTSGKKRKCQAKVLFHRNVLKLSQTLKWQASHPR
jgi:hypothetical protein